MRRFIAGGLSVNKSNGLEKLRDNIINQWRLYVKKDLKKYPQNTDAIDSLAIYGTTLIAIALTKDCWFGLQIGDGKCVVLWDNGSWTQPIPGDKRCFLNVTTSLCDNAAAGLFRYCWHTEFPSAIFIGTDGVDNSYPFDKNDEYLTGFYQKLLDNFVIEGYNNGTKQLCEMLPLFSARGSGDDVSIAGIIREPFTMALYDTVKGYYSFKETI
jgi:hypothetical protein